MRANKVFAVGDSWGGRRVVAASTQKHAATALGIAVRVLREFGTAASDAEVVVALSRPNVVFATRGERAMRLRRGPDPLVPET